MDFVFGKDGLVECATPTDLSTRLESRKTSLDIYEGQVLGMSEDYTSRFWKYMKKEEKMMAQHMIQCQRKQAGMPYDHTGIKPARPYTNQSESLNNILTRQKEAMSKAPKSKVPTKNFVKNVWEEVTRHQPNELTKALVGMGEEYCLTEDATYLMVKQEWFAWSAARRTQYLTKFNSLTLVDVMRRKVISLPPENSEVPRFKSPVLFGRGFKDQLQHAAAVSADVAETLIQEAEALLTASTAIPEMPSMMSSE